jgi:hypothetical protein
MDTTHRIPPIDVIRAVVCMATEKPKGGPKVYETYRRTYPAKDGWWLPNDFTRNNRAGVGNAIKRPKITSDGHRTRTRLIEWGLVEHRVLDAKRSAYGIDGLRLTKDKRPLQNFLRELMISIHLLTYDINTLEEIFKQDYIGKISKALNLGPIPKTEIKRIHDYIRLRREADRLLEQAETINKSFGGRLTKKYSVVKDAEQRLLKVERLYNKTKEERRSFTDEKKRT